MDKKEMKLKKFEEEFEKKMRIKRLGETHYVEVGLNNNTVITADSYINYYLEYGVFSIEFLRNGRALGTYDIDEIKILR